MISERQALSVHEAAVALRPEAAAAPAVYERPSRAGAAGAHAARAHVWTATGHEEQVFLDRSGRRKHLMRVGGAVAALLSALWLVALVTGMVGFASVPTLLLHAQRDRARGAVLAQTVTRSAHTVARASTLTLAQTPLASAAAPHAD